VNETKTERPALARVSAGNAQADEILHGGFPANSINVIMGQPGTGKSIFIEQMVFHNAGGKRPILHLSTLSEPVTKALRYLQQFSFFDASKVGTDVLYEDIGDELVAKGIDALVPRIRAAIETIAPKIIVIDSFKALHDLGAPHSDMRRALYEVTGQLTAYDTTVFLVGEYTEEHGRHLPEFAIADGIVQLMRKDLSTRDERFLRVLKLRGSGYIEGQHGFRITPEGIRVYPRLVSPEIPKGYKPLADRTSTGIDGLDDILGGGVLRGSTNLVVGPTGAGKTTICLQFAARGLAAEEKALYVNFQENPVQLARSLALLGVEPEEAQRRGMHFLYMSPVELQIDHVIVTMFAMIREKGIRRVVIDSVGDLATSASDPERFHDFLYALVQHFAVSGISTFMTLESNESHLSATMDGRLSVMSDAIISLSMVAGKRMLTVSKARATAHDILPHEFTIGAQGVQVMKTASPAARSVR
jgi:circadian clock protein KaiC